MSFGIAICSKCKREVHQQSLLNREQRFVSQSRKWVHCEDGSDICTGATAVHATSTAEIQGKWCGADDLFGELTKEKKR